MVKVTPGPGQFLAGESFVEQHDSKQHVRVVLQGGSDKAQNGNGVEVG